MPPEAIAVAVDELSRDRSAMLLTAANRELWQLMRDGVKVSVPDPVKGGAEDRAGAGRGLGKSRGERFPACFPDDGHRAALYLPPGFDRFRERAAVGGDRAEEAGRAGEAGVRRQPHQLQARAERRPGVVLVECALLIASNGTDSRVGSLTADWERFFEWKRIEREDEPRRVSLEVMLRGTCAPARLLDIAENFTLFSEHKSGLTKIIGQNHQFIGVNNAIRAMLKAREEGHGRGGVFWQTQGSGKSFSMVFFAQKVLRKVPGNWTFVVVTDRVELDEQIAKTFAACGAVSDAQVSHAQSGAQLRELLSGNNRYVFTLIHKFQPDTSSTANPSQPPLEASQCCATGPT